MFSHQTSAHCWCDALLNVHLMSPSAWSDAGSSQHADQTSFCSAARRLNQVLCASRSIFSRLCRPCPGSSNTTTTRPAARKRACGWNEAFVRPDDCESLYWQRKPGVKWCDAAERPPLWPRIKLRQERRPWQIPTAGRSGEFCMNSGVIQSVATRWLAFWVDSPPALSHSQGQSVSSQQSVSVLGFVWVEKVTSARRDVLTHFHIYTRQNKEMVWSQRQKWRIIVKVCPLKSPRFKDFHMFIWRHFHLLPMFYSGKEIRGLLWDCEFYFGFTVLSWSAAHRWIPGRVWTHVFYDCLSLLSVYMQLQIWKWIKDEGCVSAEVCALPGLSSITFRLLPC